MTKTHCFSGKLSQTKDQGKFYHTYINMKGRCNNPSNKSYADYGARGIRCERESFEEFKHDMRELYWEHINIHGRDDTTIERINNNGNYCKENCKRATRREQNNNKRNNKMAVIDGREYTATDLMNIVGIGEGAAQNRITQYLTGNMSKERLFSKEKLFQPRKKYDIDGELYDVHRLMEECGITISAAEHRLRKYAKGEIGKEFLFHIGNFKCKKKQFIS